MKVLKSNLVRKLHFAIMCLALLNANVVVYLFTGISQVFSPVYLVAAITIILLRILSVRISVPMVSLLGFLLVYLIFGIVGNSGHGTLDVGLRFLLRFSGSLLILLSVYLAVSQEIVSGRLDILANTIRNILTISCILTILTPFFDEYYVSEALTVVERASGIFENPNEAGMIAVYLLVFTLWFPPRYLSTNVFLLIVSAVSATLTFSKTAILAWLVVALVSLLRSRPVAKTIRAQFVSWFGVLGLVTLAAFVISNPVRIANFVSVNQMERISEITKLVGFKFTEETTTKRNILFEVGLTKFRSNFPYGAGLGSFHSLEDGPEGRQGNLGVHNSILMVAGESGALAAALLVFCLFTILYKIVRKTSLTSFEASIFFLLIMDMAVTHSAFEMRYHNYLLAFLLASIARHEIRSPIITSLLELKVK